MANSFLANLSTSALFATILVEYLLERLPEMGSNVELSNLYLKLFKLVFGSVSLFAAENEQMLKVNGCLFGNGTQESKLLKNLLSIRLSLFFFSSATPPQDSEQLHGASPVSKGTLQLLSASSGSLPLYWGR